MIKKQFAPAWLRTSQQKAPGNKGSKHVQVTLRLFALAKQTVGQSELPLQLPESATVADLRQELALTCPALAPLLPSLMVAINSEYVDDQTIIEAGQEIALIPPVSGGAESQPTTVLSRPLRPPGAFQGSPAKKS